ncbi:MAG: PRC-barrel domain-containing protein [Actinomycetota bacterium]|nr:PRC-barrel domain-containing protein [Actinomycetota bacterium]
MSEQGKQPVTDPAELGRPVAYLALKDGTPVYDRSGRRVGVLEHVVIDEPTDIFEGLIVHTLPLPGRHLFADRDQIAALHERGVLLSVDRDKLHDPSQKSTRPTNPDNPVESPIQSRLRHAWDWISGQL